MPKPTTNLRFNVAQLLREMTGGRRQYTFEEPRLMLDDQLALRDLEGSARFTRTIGGVLATVRTRAVAEMECTRCLAPAPQAVSVDFDEEFHARVDVNTGVPLPKPDEDDPFFIDENHLLDLGEALREYGLLALPIRSLCRPECKGLCPSCGADLNVGPCGCADSDADDRLAALRSLLPREE